MHGRGGLYAEPVARGPVTLYGSALGENVKGLWSSGPSENDDLEP